MCSGVDEVTFLSLTIIWEPLWSKRWISTVSMSSNPSCEIQHLLPFSWVSWHLWLNSHSMGLAYSERQSHLLPYFSSWVCSFLCPDSRNNAFFGSILISQGLALLSFHAYHRNTHTGLWVGRRAFWASIWWSVRLELDNNQNTSLLWHAWSVTILCVHHWALSCLHLNDTKWIPKGNIWMLEWEGCSRVRNYKMSSKN